MPAISAFLSVVSSLTGDTFGLSNFESVKVESGTVEDGDVRGFIRIGYGGLSFRRRQWYPGERGPLSVTLPAYPIRQRNAGS